MCSSDLSAVLSIVEIYIGRSYLVYSTELILFNISSICLLAVYIQSSSVSEKMKNQIYENVVNNLRELIFYYDLYPAKRFQYISPSVKDLTGYSQQAFYDNPKLLVDIVFPGIKDLGQMGLTFFLVVIGWIVFRADSTRQARRRCVGS